VSPGDESMTFVIAGGDRAGEAYSETLRWIRLASAPQCRVIS
jgi:hypothetical protein